MAIGIPGMNLQGGFPGLPVAGPGVAQPSSPVDPGMLMQLIQTLLQLLQSQGMNPEQAQQALADMGLGALTGAPATGGTGNAGSAAMIAPQQAAGQAQQALEGARSVGAQVEGMLRGDAPNVAVLDDFSGPGSHGEEIAGLIENGDPEGGAIGTLRYNVNGGGDVSANIAGSLGDVARRVAQGEKVDAVNLSQQSFQASGSSQAVRDRIAQLQQLGVPVVVSAGNGGPGQQNPLAGGAALVVENSARGSEGRSACRSIASASITWICINLLRPECTMSTPSPSGPALA